MAPSLKSVAYTQATSKKHVSNANCAPTQTSWRPWLDGKNRRYSSTAVGFPRNLNQKPRPPTVFSKFFSRADARTSAHARNNEQTPPTMKIENLTELYDITLMAIDNLQPTIIDYMSPQMLIYVVMNIYLNNDTSKSVTNHVNNSMTIIASEMRVSVIWDDHSTNYRIRVPLCLYENLNDDITNILSCIDICIDRLLDQ